MSRSSVSFFTSTDRIIKVLFSCRLISALLVLIWIPLTSAGFSFKAQLIDRNSKSFQHWNTKKKKVTGYTVVTYSTDMETGGLLETSEHLDHKQTVYAEKTLLFDQETGRLNRYVESDLRTDMKTMNTYTKDHIHTRIWKKGKKTEFDIDITPDLVPFEVLSFYLQSQLKTLQKKQSIRFTLYLPVIALELKDKGLPLSLSQLEMQASVAAVKTRDTPFGSREIAVVRVEPTSFFVKALLPANKSTFDFSFVHRDPFPLIQFEEGDTQTRLVQTD